MESERYDVVCIGAGGAGVTAAVTAARRGAKVAIVSKEPIGYGNTRIAVGAMSCTGMAPADSVQTFVSDIITGGEEIGNVDLAEAAAVDAPAAVALLESFGYFFKRDGEGRLSERAAFRTAGHSIARSASGARPGMAIGAALRAAAASAPLTILEDTVACRLLVQDGRVVGVVCLHLPSGEPRALSAKAVLLATGGLGWLYYPHTDCMRSCTGDGYALAYWAGAELVDMEQVQFIPFGITHPSSMVGIFCGEPAHAGDGVLLNRHGRVVLTGLDRMTRAQVAKTICFEVLNGGGTEHGGLLLDLSPNYASGRTARLRQLQEDGGMLDTIRAAYGERAAKWEEPWDVAPTAHFHMGGVLVDDEGRSTVPGLYAAGEAQGGLHGGNRLGSVALTEIFVFGRRAGEAMARDAAATRWSPPDPALVAAEVAHVDSLYGRNGSRRPVALARRLQDTLWQKAGPVRDESGLAAAARQIESLREEAADLRTSPSHRYNPEALDAVELEFMLTVAGIVVRCALERQESRGAHVRLDFPNRDDERWLRNIVVRQEAGQMAVTTREVRR